MLVGRGFWSFLINVFFKVNQIMMQKGGIVKSDPTSEM